MSEDSPRALREIKIIDHAEQDESLDILPQYTVFSYGADFDVAGLVKRLNENDIEIAGFQRGFVWTNRQAARFIESLLIGFPVPGIFLWRDPTTESLVVIDGQQRLRSLQAFLTGIIRGREFALPQQTSPYQIVSPSFRGRTYRTLDEEDRRRLDNSIIHATVVVQQHPPEDDSSIYYLFERINTEGTALASQEIRAAIYRGTLIDLLAELNLFVPWRTIYGPPSPRMKDRELILRFLALNESSETYARPMKEFLNQYVRRNRNPDPDKLAVLTDTLQSTVGTIADAVGPRAFRPQSAINAAVYDAVMVGVARRLRQGPISDAVSLLERYQALLHDPEFQPLYSRATADIDRVQGRLALATAAFTSLE